MKTINELEVGTCIKLKDGSFVSVQNSPEIGLFYANYQNQDENGEELNPEEYLEESEIADLDYLR